MFVCIYLTFNPILPNACLDNHTLTVKKLHSEIIVVPSIGLGTTANQDPADNALQW
jgi:hypothetical protein